MLKMRYVARIEITDEAEQNESVLPIEEIRHNIQLGMIEDSLKSILSEGFMHPNIIITRMFADVYETDD